MVVHIFDVTLQYSTYPASLLCDPIRYFLRDYEPTDEAHNFTEESSDSPLYDRHCHPVPKT